MCYSCSVPYKDPLDPRARESRRKHYNGNKEQYRERNRLSKEECLDLIKRTKDVPCMDCGKKYPHYVMDFDHRDPSLKSGNIPVLARYGINKLTEEIAKCDVVCSNCHRERTHGS